MKNKNIPNCLSFFRIILIPVFIYFYVFSTIKNADLIAVLVLVLSGLTDMLDGLIARKYNMVTKLGIVLDPFADKLTQCAVFVSIAMEYPYLIALAVIFVLKELLMIIGGITLYKKRTVVFPAKWYGKLATILFYLATGSVIAFPNMGAEFKIILFSAVLALVLVAFVMYLMAYVKQFKKAKKTV